ncbi:hypothetical protein QBC38DRAFT_467001 [Podospora fimiseda]|uniref:Uncharacterized protein n=1 Tax=Podospora fimiseda TaxID=252190 RepID=A0AAN7BWX4_9PEZI|nr:hypothetical protein QBC38DRAFT_467001 [Podospora fimiseda]
MPPQLFKPSSICALQTALSACRISPAASLRPFTSTPSLPSSKPPIPPESPKFIQVPEPPQSSEVKLPPIRGHLPVPRVIFRKREGRRKVTKGYVEAATPLSRAERMGRPPKSAQDAQHRLDAASRRAALAAGIKGLWNRKRKATNLLIQQSAKKAKEYAKAIKASERPDEIFTRPTVRADTALKVSVELDPFRFQRAAAAKQRHAHILKRKAEARADALAQLYVSAKNFIVDEATLKERVETLFKSGSEFTGYGSDNVWSEQGHPISVRQLQAKMTGESEVYVEANKTPQERTTIRQKSVAEELTGGKL